MAAGIPPVPVFPQNFLSIEVRARAKVQIQPMKNDQIKEQGKNLQTSANHTVSTKDLLYQLLFCVDIYTS